MVPPEQNNLKLNTDGASRGNPGGGCIIRNHTGHVVAFGYSKYGAAIDMVAELRALHDGFKMFQHFNLQNYHLTIETDSLALVHAFNSSRRQWNAWYYWKDIKALVENINFHIVHIYREAYCDADFLANLGITNSSYTFSNNMMQVPKVLKGITTVDRMGFGAFRNFES